MVKRIGVVGLGLIGGSIASALNNGYEITGVDSDPETIRYCLDTGIVGRAGEDGLAECEAIFVCTPLSSVRTCVERVYEIAGDRAVITDAASVKGMLEGLNIPRLVGGHPMAGTEHSGIRAAKAHLFENAYYPVVGYRASEADIAYVEGLVRTMGARPVRMTAAVHDEYVADISHMPHLLAYALAALPEDALGIAGTGFYDMTRVARSDPGFWEVVMRMNRDNVLASLDKMEERLSVMRQALADADYGALRGLMEAGRIQREKLERDKPYLNEYPLYVDVVDRPGEVERVSKRLAGAGINVKSLAIVNSREGVGGALRLGFGSERDLAAAAKLLKEKA